LFEQLLEFDFPEVQVWKFSKPGKKTETELFTGVTKTQHTKLVIRKLSCPRSKKLIEDQVHAKGAPPAPGGPLREQWRTSSDHIPQRSHQAAYRWLTQKCKGRNDESYQVINVRRQIMKRDQFQGEMHLSKVAILW
jgi:hypothetical protein